MSATPEMKWERSVRHSTSDCILLSSNAGIIRITGPSRESVVQKILAMEQVVGALRTMLSYEDDDDEHWQITEARAALTAYKGGGK